MKLDAMADGNYSAPLFNAEARRRRDCIIHRFAQIDTDFRMDLQKR